MVKIREVERRLHQVRRSEWDAVLERVREEEEAARQLAKRVVNGHRLDDAGKSREEH